DGIRDFHVTGVQTCALPIFEEAFADQAVTLTLTDEIDISRGDMIVKPDNLPAVSNRFVATLVWMAEQPLQIGKQYYIKLGNSLRSEERRVGKEGRDGW